MANQSLADVFVKVRADTSRFGPELKRDTERAGGVAGAATGRSFGSSAMNGIRGLGVAIAGVFAAAGALSFISSAIAEAREAAKVQRLTEAAIKSTGGVAKVTAGQIEGLADELATLVGVDDELIQASSNLLLTFTKVRNEAGRGNDVFDQAQAAIVDMTSAMNGGEITADGLKTSTIQLGKALNDPIKGITALTKVGVTFTQQQKDQIKALVESGNIMGAQKIILAELAVEFGGAGAAAADPAARAAAAWGNLKEVLGNLFLPVLNQVMDVFTKKLVPFFQTNVLPTITLLAKGFQEHVLPGLKVVAQWVGEHVMPRLAELHKWIREKVFPVIIILAKALKEDATKGFNAIKQAIADNKPQLEQFFRGLKLAVDFIVTKVVPVIGPILQNGFKALGLAISIIIKTVSLFVDSLNWMKSVGDNVGKFFGTTVPAYFRAGVNGIETAWNRIKEVAKAPVRFVIDTVINGGILKAYNWVANLVGAKQLAPVSLPGFAAGGVIPGYKPGKDTVPAMLSEGEGIAVPQLVRQIGPERFMAWNRAARMGRPIERFADGGIAGLVSDPIGWLRDRVSGPIGSIRSAFGGNRFVDLLTSVAGTMRDAIATKIKSFVTSLFFGPVSSLGQMMGGGGSAWQMAVLRAVFPGLTLISGYRPGARTLSGNVSYHASNRAVDVPPISAVAAWIRAVYGARTRELITPWQMYNLNNGRPHTYTGAVWNQHNFAGGNAHIHWAYALGGIVGKMLGGAKSMDGGGFLSPGYNLVHNGTGRPEAVGAGGLEQTQATLREMLAELRALADAIGRSVGREITGGVAVARQLGRAR